jgi:DNA-binding winged helix-turn-helix (wHTH) protein/tetratricopeptide (TPR) repeat protein/TolB-like protein
MERGNGAIYAFGPFRVVAVERLLLRDGEPVELTAKGFDLLLLLIESAGCLKNREELIEALWPTTVVEEHSLTWNVSAVRKALDDEGRAPRYIETVRGHGYRFIAPVEVEDRGESEKVGTNGRRRRPWVVAAVAVSIVVVVVIGWFIWLHPFGGKRTSAVVPQRPAVAVLGFRNLSNDRQADWIGTALTEMVGTDLAAGGELHVAPAMAVAQVRREFNLPAGGAQLNGNMLGALRTNLAASYVTIGAYLLLGHGKSARLRVDVKLIRTENGVSVATLSKTGSRDELFSLVRSLGVGLRAHLGIAALSLAQESELRATIPASPAAARAYAEGLRALAAGNPVVARKALEQAIAVEPNFPLAYVSLAQAWMGLGDEINARTAAQKALGNSAGLARPQRLLIDGLYHEAGHEWDQAVEDYRALFTFYPDDLQYGLLLVRAQVKAGKPQDALATVALLHKLPAPVGNDPRVDLAEADAADTLGDYRRAAAAAARAAVTARGRGAYLLRARALSAEGGMENLRGHYAKALEHLGEARHLFVKVGGALRGLGVVLERIGNAYGAQGRYTEAIRAFEKANITFARVGNRYWQGAALNNIGNIYYRRNRLDEALRYYTRALPMFMDIHRELTASYVLNNLAVILGYQGNIKGAIEKYREALAIRRAAGAEAQTADTLLNLGIDYTVIGAFQKAHQVLTQAMAIYKKNGDDPDVSNVLAARADIDVQEDHLSAARRGYEQALTIRKAQGMHNEIAENERDLAELALLTDAFGKAAKLAQSAATEYRNEKAGTDEAHARAVLGLALVAESRRDDARQQLQKVKTLYADVQNIRAKMNLDILIARLEADLGNPEVAARTLQQTVVRARRSGFTTLAYWARFRLAEVQAHGGMNAKLRTIVKQLVVAARKADYRLVAYKAGILLAVRD